MSTSGHTEEAVLDAGNRGGVRQVTISDETFVFHAVGIPDRKVTGAQIAQAAGKHPADDYSILLNLPNGEVETLRPDELVDLGGQGVERFFVIKSGESYRFTVDGLSLEWPLKSLAGKHVKILVKAGDGMELVLEREDTADQVIGDDDLVHLDAAGVERLKTRPAKHKVHVKYNNDQIFELERRGYKTEELMAEFSVPAGYKLDLVRPDGEFVELKPGETTQIREGLEFVSHPPHGKSS